MADNEIKQIKLPGVSTPYDLVDEGGRTLITTHTGNTSNPHNVTKSQVGLGNVGNFKAVSTVASQGLTDTEKANARANIGAGTGSVSSVSLATGTNNGTVKLTVNGTAGDDVAVKGLGSAAYTASTAYATAVQGTKADNAEPASTAVRHTASTAVGSATQPVYVSSTGAATACTYSLNKTVPADAVFTDTHYTNTLTIQGNGTTATTFSQNADKTLNIKGSGATSVSKTADGEITISSTNTQPNDGVLTMQVNGTTKQTFSANQSTAATFNVTAADLGLSQALVFKGITVTDLKDGDTTSPITMSDSTTLTPTTGNVVITAASVTTWPNTEFVWASSKWNKLGDAKSYALSSITVTGSGVLGGGGDLTANRTITHNTSGATAGSYGDSTAQTPAYGGTFKVPYITVNNTGHVTGISEHTVKIPASDNTNQTVKGNGTAFGANDAVDIVGGTNVTVTPDTTNKKITITANNTTYSAGTGLSLSSTTFNHSNSVTAGTASEGGSARTLGFGGTFNVPSVTYDAQGHITAKGSTTLTMPANPDTNQKVKVGTTTFGANDEINIVAGSNITVTPDTTNKNITIAATDTTYGVVSTSANGLAPKVTDTSKFLKGDGTWATPANTTYSAGTGLSLSGTTFNHSNSVTAVGTEALLKVKYDAQGHVTGGAAVAKSDITALGIPGSDTNTWRNIKMNGTEILGTGTSTGALGLTAGNNVTLTNSSGTITIAATDTKYSNFTGATASAAGTNGLVPAPAAGDNNKVLRGDGTWGTVSTSDVNVTQTVSTANDNYPILVKDSTDTTTTTATSKFAAAVTMNPSTGNINATKLNGVTIGSSPKFTDTTYSAATTSADGLMSSADKVKLDGIATGATKVVESTVSDWGFTKNAGTITGITMNGSSKGTSGVVDLGTVITEHQDISGKADVSALEAKADIAAPALTAKSVSGSTVYPRAVTIGGAADPDTTDDSENIATTKWVRAMLSAIVGYQVDGTQHTMSVSTGDNVNDTTHALTLIANCAEINSISGDAYSFDIVV